MEEKKVASSNNSPDNDSAKDIMPKIQLVNYKIDLLNLDTNKMVKNILHYPSNNDNWMFNIGVRNPIFFKKDNAILGGLGCRAFLYIGKQPDENEASFEDADIRIEVGISGFFGIQSDETNIDINKNEFLKNFAKYQIPAILSPFLRACMATTVSNAGFGTLIIPLLDYFKVAKDVVIEIKE